MKKSLLLIAFALGIALSLGGANAATTEIYATDVDVAGTDLRWKRFVPPSGGPTWPAAIVLHVGGWKTGDPGPTDVSLYLASKGFITFAAEYRLAPPHSPMNTVPIGDPQQDPPSDGRPPQQTDDVQRAIRAARADSQCNGKVVIVGGSAGATHAMWWAIKGTTGDDRADAVACLSGIYDLDNSTALLDPQLLGTVENYINHTQTEGAPFDTAAKDASPYWRTEINSSMAPSLIISSETESIPLVEYTTMQTKLASVGADFESFKRSGATEHAFSYWSLGGTGSTAFPIVKDYVVDFLFRKLNTTAPPLAYPKGIWGQYGAAADIPATLVSNLGIVGIGVSEDWDVIESVAPISGVHQYNWTPLDAKIAQATAAGFKINLIITNSSDNTPQWLIDQETIANPSEVIQLTDPASNHSTYCKPIPTVVYWNNAFHQARLLLAAAAGAHYANNPNIVVVTAQAFNHNSNDWNIQDNVNPIGDELPCPACPQTPPRLCGPQVLDQPQQWLDAGWTEPIMIEVGQELMTAYANAFPNKNIKFPIGGMENRLASEGRAGGGDYSRMARDMEDFVYGNVLLSIPAQPYAGRFWFQRNIVDANWGNGFDKYDPAGSNYAIPGTGAQNYIKYMIYKHAQQTGPTPRQAGLQMVSAATGGLDGCRLDGKAGGPCDDSGTPGVVECPEVCTMQAALDIAWTYNVTFTEVFPQDAKNPAFAAMFVAKTIEMGGTPRGGPQQPNAPANIIIKRGGTPTADVARKPFPGGGIYLTGGQDPLSFFEGTLSAVFDDPNVDMLRLRIGWSDIQPTSLASYNWTRLDNALAVCLTKGKKLGLSISSGRETPDWVYDDAPTTPRFTIDPADDGGGFQPIPWNAAYQAKWQTFIQAMATRYDANPALAYVVISGFMQHNEMYLSKADADDIKWNDRAVLDGYANKSAAYVPAAETIVGYFETAFLQTPCILTLARVWSLGPEGDTDKNTVNDDMHAAYPGWYGEMVAFVHATLPPHDTTPVVVGFPKIGQAVSSSNDDTRFYSPPLPGAQPATPQPLDDAFKNAQGQGRTALELWAADVTNPAHASTLAAGRLLLISNLGTP